MPDLMLTPQTNDNSLYKTRDLISPLHRVKTCGLDTAPKRLHFKGFDPQCCSPFLSNTITKACELLYKKGTLGNL